MKKNEIAGNSFILGLFTGVIIGLVLGIGGFMIYLNYLNIS